MDELEERIGYRFKEPQLLREAMTHSSLAHERTIGPYLDYERLEYLGDAVLELVTSDYLYHEYPNMTEGELTKTRACLVCESALAEVSRTLGLDRCVMLGKGEEAVGGRTNDSILCDICESLIGALYLDAGMDTARKHIIRFVLVDLEMKRALFDSKSLLQEYAQSGHQELTYEIIAEDGPAHDRQYTAAAYIDGRRVGIGTGRSKKTAQQQAAYAALGMLKKELRGVS